MSVAEMPPDFLPAGSQPAAQSRAANDVGTRADADSSPLGTPEFGALIVKLLPDVRRYARKLTSQRAESQDLVQDTCRRAMESQARFTRGTDMRAWLLCVLRNLHRDRLRQSSREVLTGDRDDELPTPALEEHPRWDKVSDEDLDQALALLPPYYQRAYVLHAVHGHSYGEIARELQISSGTVGSRITRARLRMREFLTRRLAAQS
jgi:RNA polymerase sigma-70 factor, ECF subfamily